MVFPPNTELMKPSVEKMANATAYTRIQEMKFGMVVAVCTKRLKRLLGISFKKTAKARGTQLVMIPRKLMARVFFITRKMSFLVASFSNRNLNHLKPTKLSLERVCPD